MSASPPKKSPKKPSAQSPNPHTPPDMGDKTKIIVKNLSEAWDAYSLGEICTRIAPIKSLEIPTYYKTTKSKGFGYATFFSSKDAELAIKSLNGSVFRGRKIYADWFIYNYQRGDFHKNAPTTTTTTTTTGEKQNQYAKKHDDDATLEYDLVELTPESQELIDEAFDSHLVPYDKHLLGQISKTQLRQGLEVLQDLKKALLKDKSHSTSSTQSILNHSNKFYTIIPHNFGEDDPPLLDNMELVDSKIEIMKDLLSMY